MKAPAPLFPTTPSTDDRIAELDRLIAAEQRRLLSTASLSLQQVQALKSDVHKRMLSLKARRRALNRQRGGAA